LAILSQVTWPWAQLPDESIPFKFLLETRLKSEDFELSIISDKLSIISGSKVTAKKT